MLKNTGMRTLRVTSGSWRAKSTAFYTLEFPLLRVELHSESVRKSNVAIMSSRLFSFKRADSVILGSACRLSVDHGSEATPSMVSNWMGVPINIFFYFYPIGFYFVFLVELFCFISFYLLSFFLQLKNKLMGHHPLETWK